MIEHWRFKKFQLVEMIEAKDKTIKSLEEQLRNNRVYSDHQTSRIKDSEGTIVSLLESYNHLLKIISGLTDYIKVK